MTSMPSKAESVGYVVMLPLFSEAVVDMMIISQASFGSSLCHTPAGLSGWQALMLVLGDPHANDADTTQIVTGLVP